MGKKYYAVVHGRQPGIYNTWSETQQQVNGFPGAIYKGFASYQAAKKFMDQSNETITNNYNLTQVQQLQQNNIPSIYTDGSYKDGRTGYAVVHVLNEATDTVKIHYGHVQNDLAQTNNVGELYAIYVALTLIPENINIYTDSRYVISSLTSYIHEWIQTDWRGIANKNILITIYQLMQNRKINFYHVAAHTGNKYNEMADKWANQGRLSNQNLITINT